MINIFEEAFKANSQLSKKSLNEAKVTKPKPDLSNNPRSMTAILQKHKEELSKATSVEELFGLVSKWFKGEGLNTEASKRLLKNIASKKDIESAQFVVYNSILAGAGQEVIEAKTGLKSKKREFEVTAEENYTKKSSKKLSESNNSIYRAGTIDWAIDIPNNLSKEDEYKYILKDIKTKSKGLVDYALVVAVSGSGGGWPEVSIAGRGKKFENWFMKIYDLDDEDDLDFYLDEEYTVPQLKEDGYTDLKTMEENYTKKSSKKSVKEDVETFQPDEDILVVYNDKLEDDMSDEEIKDTISASVGKCVCKCGVCGANYIVTDDTVTDTEDTIDEVETTEVEESVKKTHKKSKLLDESMLFKGLSLLEADDEDLDIDVATKDDVLDSIIDTEDVEEITSKEDETECTCECPICGATEQQAIVGTISEDDVITLDKDEEVNDKTDEDDVEDKDDIEDTIEIKDDEDFDDTSVEDITSEETEEVDEPKVESKRRLRKRVKEAKDTEDTKDKYAYSTREDPNPDPKFIISSNVDGEICRVSTEFDAKRTIETFKIEDKRDPSRKNKDIKYTYTLDDTVSNESCDYRINERALNRLFTKFATENYENVKNVIFTRGKILKDNNIKLEGVVNTVSGKVRSITLESVGFTPKAGAAIIKFTEKGPFTESAKLKSNKVPFVVECSIRGKLIQPKAIKYNYKLSESKDSYAVYGRHTLVECQKVKSYK